MKLWDNDDSDLIDTYRNNDSGDNGDVMWICKHNRRADRCYECSPQYNPNYPWTTTKQNQTQINHKKELQQNLQDSWWPSSSTKSSFSHPQTRFYWFLVEKWFIRKKWKKKVLIYMTLETLNNKLKTCGMIELKNNKRWKIPWRKTFRFTNSILVKERWISNIYQLKKENGETLYALDPVFPKKEHKRRKKTP